MTTPRFRSKATAIASQARSKRITFGVALTVGALVIPLGIGHTACFETTCPVGGFDIATLAWARQWQSPELTSLFIGLTWLGSMAVLLPLSAGLAWGYRKQPASLFIPLSVAGASCISALTKILVARPRPAIDHLVELPPDASFPSGHAMQATAFFVAWAWYCNREHRWFGVCLAAALIASVGASRLYLQVHYPTDVIVGSAAALLWVTGLRYLLMPAADPAQRWPA